MLKTKRLICIILAIAALASAFSAIIIASMVAGEKPEAEDEEEYVAGGKVYPMDNLSNTSFFEESFSTSDKESWEYINPYYDAYPETENTSNFHSKATAVYEGINGAVVTVDTLYRQYSEALNDPNYACGMLMYQCIQYKIAHPEEKVSLSFSSYRVSPTAAVCLNPNSPYFGYMRSLYDSDYDENGFVRIVYLLVEAAKMGIDVTIVGHENSYAVKQYNNSTGKTYSAEEPSYIEYFNKSLEYQCYEKYAKGDTVADHMVFRPIEWDREPKSSLEVMHVKTCTASHYIDKYGTEHRFGVWLSSTNLDAITYKGYNGNNGSQSGVVITGHEQIYNTVVNYVALMAEHSGQEDVFELRNTVIGRNTEQIALILEGKGDQIPENERIVYLGSESDDVFELYFTPVGGDLDTWDTVNNPYCKFIQEFYDSEDEDVVLSWNNPNFLEDFFISKTIVSAIYDKFITNKRIGNRLGIRCQNGTFEGFSSLKSGKDLEYINFTTAWDKVHDKDIMMSYVKDGERRYVSFLSTCNFNIGAVYYQTNSVLVIKETEETDNVVYRSLGQASSKGVIVDDGRGMTFSSDERLECEKLLPSFPQTLQISFRLDRSEETDTYGILFSNSDFWNTSVSYLINKNGNPQIVLGRTVESGGVRNFKENKYTFDKIDVRTGNEIRLTFVTDLAKGTASCYVDGELNQTLTGVKYLDENYVAVNPFVVGGSYLGSNYACFKGEMYSLSAWSDIRSEKEIKAGGKIDAKDEALMMSFDFGDGRIQNAYGDDASAYDNDLKAVKLWLDKSEVIIPDDYAYSFAVVGDTQALSWFDPDGMAKIYDWLVANKDEHKIEYVIGLGDITEESSDREFEFAKQQIYKLSGVVPFSLVTGNHDKYDFKSQGYVPEDRKQFAFNKTFCNDTYLAELDGWYGEGDVTCSYNAFEIGDAKWLLLNLDFGPTAEMLNWAADVIEKHADHRVIVVTHAYLYRDGSTLDKGECYPSSEHNPVFKDGDEIWEELVSKYENIELVLCGHDPWDHIVCSQKAGEKGNVVTQLLINPQYMDKHLGTSAMVAMLYFSEDGSRMTVRYYSVARDKYGSALSQFTVELN